jgi:signal transduction histidine kinase/ActR/RegA family two-component response regulator
MNTAASLALRVSMEHLLEGVQLIGFDWRYQFVNETAAQHGQRTPADLVGRTLMECYPGIERTEMFAALERVMRTRRAERLLNEFEYPTTGKHRWFELLIDPVPEGICVLSMDVTEREQIAAQLRQAQKMEVVGRLTGGIAHDLNNVLTAILGYSELALEAALPTEVRADVEEVRKAGERASALLRRLLAFSRSNTVSRQVLDVNAVVGGLEKLLTRVVRADIRLEFDLTTKPLYTKADPAELEQVLLNLVVNSADAMPQGGRVRISTLGVDVDAAEAAGHEGAQPGRFAALRVADSGIGMSPDVLEQIFEPFFTTKDAGKGTGLGLSTVNRIVREAGGYITVTSTPGTGTVMTTYLPAAQAPAAHASRVQEAAHTSDTSATILIVEQDAAIRELMRKALDQQSHTAIEARSVSEAVALSERFPGRIDLLITDILMQDVSGPHLAQRLLGARPEMTVLYVAATAAGTLLESESVSRRVRFLSKPFTIPAFANSVRQSLAGAR